MDTFSQPVPLKGQIPQKGIFGAGLGFEEPDKLFLQIIKIFILFYFALPTGIGKKEN